MGVYNMKLFVTECHWWHYVFIIIIMLCEAQRTGLFQKPASIKSDSQHSSLKPFSSSQENDNKIGPKRLLFVVVSEANYFGLIQDVHVILVLTISKRFEKRRR